MNGYNSERLSQEGECRNEKECCILDAASEAARRVLEEIEALAGTTTCKSVQLVRLRKWAEEHGCWFNDRSQFGDFIDRGSENEVYLYFIDTIIYASDIGGIDKYNRLSPRANSSKKKL